VHARVAGALYPSPTPMHMRSYKSAQAHWAYVCAGGVMGFKCLTLQMHEVF